jgi:outer membrane immunogenic protein
MKRAAFNLLIGAGLASAIAGAATPGVAADLPVKAPYVPYFTWAGFYAGAHFGFGWNDPELVASASSSIATIPVPGAIPTGLVQATAVSPPTDSSGRRFEGGGQVGFNLQTGIWVYGVEADISAGRRRIGTNANGNLVIATAAGSLNVLTASFAEAQVDWYSTARARLGVARDRWLVYATGGVAYGQLNVTNTFNPQVLITAAPGFLFGATSTVTNNQTKVGWAAGAGTAYAWSDTVSLFAEWVRVDLGSASASQIAVNTIPGPPAINFVNAARSDVTGRFDVLQAGVNVKLY